jgi:RNA polymerase sigma factor (sigma-70 family)
VLLRRAASLERSGALASWLYGVAYRVSIKAREKSERLRRRERQVDDMNVPAKDSADHGELRALLDRELAGLPDKLRAPLVLCYLQGKTNEQAADELGLPAGSMSKRLARGRELLRERLNARGLAYSSAVLATALASEANALPPAALVSNTCSALIAAAAGQKAAVSAQSELLAKGVLRTMFLERSCKMAVLTVAMASVLVLGAGLARQTFHTQAAAYVPVPAQPAQAPLARQARLPILSSGTLIARESVHPLVQVGVFPEESYAAYVRTIPGIAPARLATVVGADKRFDLDEPRAGQPLSVVIVGPKLNSGESIRPALLTRQDKTFTLVLELWRDNGERAKNFVARGAHMLSLGTVPAGNYELRVIVHDMLLDYQSPLPRYYRQVGQEAGKLAFQVLDAAAPTPKPRSIPALEREALKLQDVLPADRERNFQHPLNGHTFPVPAPWLPAETIALGSDVFNYDFWLRDKKAGKLPASLTKVGREQAVHVWAVSPTELNSGEFIDFRAIQWEGQRVRIQVNVWRDQGQRFANVIQQPLIETVLQLPTEEANQVARALPGKYEVVIEWNFLEAATLAQPYAVKETRSTKATFEVE